MPAWTDDDLRLIADTADLYVAPFREDGRTYGTFTRTWALVVDGDVYVRAANGQDSRWYRAAIAQRAGRVRVADRTLEVTFERAPSDVDGIDLTYEAKYPGSSAVPVMQAAGPAPRPSSSAGRR